MSKNRKGTVTQFSKVRVHKSGNKVILEGLSGKLFFTIITFRSRGSPSERQKVPKLSKILNSAGQKISKIRCPRNHENMILSVLTLYMYREIARWILAYKNRGEMLAFIRKKMKTWFPECPAPWIPKSHFLDCVPLWQSTVTQFSKVRVHKSGNKVILEGLSGKLFFRKRQPSVQVSASRAKKFQKVQNLGICDI